MVYFMGILLLLRAIQAYGVNVEVQGLIDLGPKWSFEYNIAKPNRDVKQLIMRDSMKTRDITKQAERTITKMFKPISQSDDIYESTRLIKHDRKINDFAFHIYKQSLKVLDLIKRKIDPSLYHKIDLISRSYNDKFRGFINDTFNYKIKTRLGTQKVILNTIDTSSRLLKRLVNYFIGEANQNGYPRNKMAASHVLLKEVDKEYDLENKHACAKFGICRNSKGFNNFMAEVLGILIKSGNEQLKQASDALTEVLRDTDLSEIMEAATEKRFQRKVSDVESWDADITRAVFTILRNIITMRYHPIKVMMRGGEHTNSTVVILEIMEDFDKVLAPNGDNLLEWRELKDSLHDWSAEKRRDILDIMQRLVSHFVKGGIDKMDANKKEELKRKFSLLFGRK